MATKKPRGFSAKTEAKLAARLAKAGQRGGAFQSPPEAAVYDRPAGTTGPRAKGGLPVGRRSGLEIFPAVRMATRRLQAHVGPSPQASRVTRRRRI
jgi:hypothetical protein